MDQFARSATVGTFHDKLTGEVGLEACFFELFVKRSPHSKIRVKNPFRADKRQPQLSVGPHRTTIDGLSKPSPRLSATPELRVLPCLFVSHESLPMELVRGLSRLHNVFVDATRTDGAHLQFLKDLEEFLIKESSIEWHHNRSILSIAPADSLHHMANHLLNRVRVVAVLAASSKHGIHNETPPCQMKPS